MRLRILFIFILFQKESRSRLQSGRDSFFSLACSKKNVVKKVREFLGAEVDNSSLILFRMLFGFLIIAESIGAIATGWVDRTLIQPQFTFSFIGFEWLQPLPAAGMYTWFSVMGLLGLAIMLGYRYRVSMALFFVLWSLVYFMQKSHYNNHYYLMVLLSFVMIWMPANRHSSLDVRHGRVRKSNSCPRIWIWFFIIQIGVVYLFASFNKINTDWLMGRPLGVWFSGKTDYPFIGSLLGLEWFPQMIAIGGVVYDGLIVFILLHPRTRKIGFVLSVLFNLFNSAVFQIGVFPYMMIALTVFFFPGESIRKVFFTRRESVEPVPASLSNYIFAPFVIYFFVQILLPLRHYTYRGDAHWTEEGHRLSWQMMLRAKSSTAKFTVVDKESGEVFKIKKSDYLTAQQQSGIGGKPDMVWQFAQRLKQEYADKGLDVSVYVKTNVSLNGSEYKSLIDPEVDLGSVPWDYYKHSEWILDENRPTQ